MLLHFLLHRVPNDLEQHVKLNPGAEQNCDGDQNFYGLCWQRFHRQIERNRSFDVGSVPREADEADEPIKQRDDQHSQVQNTESFNHLLRVLHVVLKRQHDAYRFHGEDSDAEERRNVQN